MTPVAGRHPAQLFWRFLMMTCQWALSLVPIMAMSVRILFTSHDRCWSVGSLPGGPSLSESHWHTCSVCHLAICASASISGSLASSSDCSRVVEPDYPSLEVAEDDNSEERAILCESGARPGVHGLLA